MPTCRPSRRSPSGGPASSRPWASGTSFAGWGARSWSSTGGRAPRAGAAGYTASLHSTSRAARSPTPTRVGRRAGGGGWVVEGAPRRFYHAGDRGYSSGFREIGERLGPIDLAALPIGAYDPPSMMQFVHLDPEDAVRAAIDLGTRRIVAMHWG